MVSKQGPRGMQSDLTSKVEGVVDKLINADLILEVL